MGRLSLSLFFFGWLTMNLITPNQIKSNQIDTGTWMCEIVASPFFLSCLFLHPDYDGRSQVDEWISHTIPIQPIQPILPIPTHALPIPYSNSARKINFLQQPSKLTPGILLCIGTLPYRSSLHRITCCDVFPPGGGGVDVSSRS